MSFKIIPVQSFLKDVKYLSKRHASLKNDLKNLNIELTLNPRLGKPIGKNCYKIRLQINSKGKGKSGGTRIITLLLVTLENQTLYLLKIYDQGDQENITETELKQLLLGIAAL